MSRAIHMSGQEKRKVMKSRIPNTHPLKMQGSIFTGPPLDLLVAPNCQSIHVNGPHPMKATMQPGVIRIRALHPAGSACDFNPLNMCQSILDRNSAVSSQQEIVQKCLQERKPVTPSNHRTFWACRFLDGSVIEPTSSINSGLISDNVVSFPPKSDIRRSVY